MPIVEALSFKLPVIASDIPVFREVARDAALFAPLGDTDLVAEYIEKIRTDSELLSKLTSRGLKLCDAYNWHDSAATTLSALCRIAES